MNKLHAHVLPRAGLGFGVYPERRGAPSHPGADAWRALRAVCARRSLSSLPASVDAARVRAQRIAAVASDDMLQTLINKVRRALVYQGFGGTAVGSAIGLVSAVIERTHGWSPYPTQQFAAWLMLQGGLVEMATGEGKTLAMALAAGVAALAGVPVHVLTANDYLVQRDADRLAPFFAALGLRSGAIVQTTKSAARAALYRNEVLYVTAKELGFDYLRDHHRLGDARDPRLQRALALNGAADGQPVLPHLCLALIDEADSLLLDEAVVPLILATAGKVIDAPALRRAFAIAQTLQTADFRVVAARRQASLSDRGRARVAVAVEGERGLLWPLRRAVDLVQAALVAQHALRSGIEYIVTPRGLALVDETTGRVAEGRQWQGALHAMVEIKEGLEPSAAAVTAAQITFQRFFPRYLQLAGMSGTLREARVELERLYRCRTTPVPLMKPLQRRWLGRRLLVDQRSKWAAVIESVQTHIGAGRPVLIGTDSVGSSQRLSAALRRAGIEHQVLNALQNEDEAERIARAGRARCVTVTTNMAGRGTDIQLDTASRAAGGLHVIVALVNRARRIDRQLIGRAARHGDPGSAEALLALDDELLASGLPVSLQRLARACARGAEVPVALAAILVHGVQRAAERRDARLRRHLQHADRQAEESFAFAGNRE